MTQYAGDPNSFPVDFTILDGAATGVVDFNISIQALGDRTAWLKAAAHPVVNVAALKALNTTGLTDGSVRHVDQLGFYILHVADVSAEQSPWVIDPTTGPGRWVHSMYLSRPRVRSQTFTASGTFVCPAEVSSLVALVVGFGGGGGGAGGGGGDSGGGFFTSGGGGGGGSVLSVVPVVLTPGATYDVTIGAGGSGGGGGAVPSVTGTAGGAGGDTVLSLVGTPIAALRGAGGGLGGRCLSGGAISWGIGGHSVRPASTVPAATEVVAGAENDRHRSQAPGEGGAGTSSNGTFRHPGMPSPQGFVGGVFGAHGTTGSSGNHGGGSGGGGGAGPAGAGGAAGNGGNGGNSGTAGSAGLPPAANTGAGGGGGGGGGSAAVTFQFAGGAGAAGGSGQLTILWVGTGL